MKQQNAEITLRPFESGDFKRLISWVPTPEAHGQWCGSFSKLLAPLTPLQLHIFEHSTLVNKC